MCTCICTVHASSLVAKGLRVDLRDSALNIFFASWYSGILGARALRHYHQYCWPPSLAAAVGCCCCGKRHKLLRRMSLQLSPGLPMTYSCFVQRMLHFDVRSCWPGFHCRVSASNSENQQLANRIMVDLAAVQGAMRAQIRALHTGSLQPARISRQQLQ